MHSNGVDVSNENARISSRISDDSMGFEAETALSPPAILIEFFQSSKHSAQQRNGATSTFPPLLTVFPVSTVSPSRLAVDNATHSFHYYKSWTTRTDNPM